MTKIKKKQYYKIQFKLVSPLMLGSGENDITDKDLIRDSSGYPYIPASSISGVLRDEALRQSIQHVEEYMGDVTVATNDKKGSQTESRIIFYDAKLIKLDAAVVSVRDSVALDEYKTAINGAKFDMEILEPGVSFGTYLEENIIEDTESDAFGGKLVKIFLDAGLTFGGKTMRGYGEIGDVKVWERSFDLTKEEMVKDWLDFDLFSNETDWESFDCQSYVTNNPSDLNSSCRLIVKLKQEGGISVRQYTTKVSDKKDAPKPDMKQLTLQNGTPVIPGSTWAGAFRHRMGEFGVNINDENSIFGYADKKKSEIRFGESQLTGGYSKLLSRNAIDRFSGGVVDKALFTELTYYGGETDLVISWRDYEHNPMPEKEQKALAAALTDLHFGFLAVGGETSIGRGLFRIISINEEPIKSAGSDVYSVILEKIGETFK